MKRSTLAVAVLAFTLGAITALLAEQDDAERAARDLLPVFPRHNPDHDVFQGHLDHGRSLPSRSQTRQAVAQARPRPVQPDANRPRRLAQERGDLLARQPVHVVQEHRATLLDRKHMERGLDDRPELARLHDLSGRRVCGHELSQPGRVHLGQRAVAAAAQPHLRQVERDAVDPAREPPRVAQTVEPEVGLEQRLLRQVFGLDGAAEQTPGERGEPRRVPVRELAEGRVVSGEAAATRAVSVRRSCTVT